ncbi:MAG: hypothetical protein ABJG68_12210 [Crocinitomicaceae bacterium]
MKKTILMFAAATLMLATPSCKKGENDPALSLASRKARFAGTWQLTGYEASSTNTEPDGDSQTSTSTLSGDVITNTYSSYDANSGSTVTTTSTVTLTKAEYMIEKDGTWSSEFITTTVQTDSYTDFWGDEITETTTTVATDISTGNWSFLGKVKDSYKSKERVVMNTLTSNYTSDVTLKEDNTTQGTSNTSNSSSTSNDNYYSGEVASTYEIDQLKGKEMIWKTMEENSGSSSWTSGGTTTSSENDTYVSDATWTFSIVK